MTSYEDILRALLAPLGVYDLSPGSCSGSELGAAGSGLDPCGEALEALEREMMVPTAEGEGLDLREALFARRPVDAGPALRRAALCALMQVSADSFTLQEINRAISGCGITARAEETEKRGCIRVLFPDVAGVPEGFGQIEGIILDLIPCHLKTEFYFRYMTWDECESRGMTWDMIHQRGYTWDEFQMDV